MNICLFADSFLPKLGGMEIAIHSLARSLRDTGCKVTVMARRSRAADKILYGYDVVRYGGSFRGSGRSGYDFLSGILALLREHRRRSFDVINCHSVAYAGHRAATAKRFLRIPLVMTPHGEDVQRVPEIGYGYRLSTSWDRIIKRSIARADAITSISDAIKDELDFVPPQYIHDIPNGIDRSQFFPGRSTFLHSLLSISPDKRIVLSVGRNHIKKGYEYGIKAFKFIDQNKECRDLVYVIIGKNTSTLADSVKTYGINNRVFLVSEQDPKTILKCYQSAWCFFSPSIIEGLSLVSIQAMATGLPLVVTDVPGNIDIVRDNDCGMIARDRDPASMADALIRLATQDELYDSFSKASLINAEAYDWGNIAMKYLEVYRTSKDRFVSVHGFH